MVGFNRRFSSLAKKAHEFFAERTTPLSVLYRVNAGRIPREHWGPGPREGWRKNHRGSLPLRRLDAVCDWRSPTSVFAEAVSGNNSAAVNEDSVFITLRFADGSNGSIAYLAEGDASLAKERVEIFGEGKTFVLDDFRRASLHRKGKEEQVALRSQDKGQSEQVKAVCAMVLSGGPSPIALDELAATTRATFRIRDSLRSGQREPIS